MQTEDLLNKIKEQTLSFAPKSFNSNMGGIPFNPIASQIPTEKPSFSEITPYKESSIYATLSDGSRVPMYENYIPGTDNNERLAQGQTAGEQWANGTAKFFTKTTNAVLGGTVGLVYGLGSALNEGSFSALYDNDFSNTLRDWDTKTNYQLANLYTKQERELGLFGQMRTANFYADKLFGGLSFTAGALISEALWAYATGGTSLATMGARTMAKWGLRSGVEATELVAGMSKYKSLYTEVLNKTVQAGRINKSFAVGASKGLEVLGTVGVLGRTAGYEASVESLQFKKEATENFYATFADKNGREPNAKDIQKFNEDLVTGANGVFATNMAILMPSNLITMGHILDIKSPFKTGIGEFLDRKSFGYGFDKATNTVLKASTGQKIARNVFDYAVKPGLTESVFEEGLQGVTTKYNNRWIEHTYDPNNSAQTFDRTDAIGKSIAEQYASKEGIVELGLGLLIGIIGGSANVGSEQKAKKQDILYKEAVSSTFNEKTLQSILLPSRIQTANRVAGFSEEAKVESQKGNIAKADFAKKSSLLSFINSEQVMGNSISETRQKISNALNSMTSEQWKESGIEADQTDQHKEETLAEFISLSKEWKTNKTYWQYIIGKKLVGEQNLTTNLEMARGGNFNKNAQIIEALAWQSTIGEAGNKMMSDIQGKISEELGQEYNTTLSTVSKLKRQTANRRGQVTKATKQYNVLLAQRDKLVKEIAKLNAQPKETEGDKVRGTQLAGRGNSLLEVNTRITALATEIEGFAQEMSTADNYTQNLGGMDFSSQNISTNTISGNDLISLQENVKKFQDTLASLEGLNPQRSQYLNDLLQEYNDAEGVFLQSQATQKALASPDFKFENIGGWISGKMKGGKAMNENTQEWLQDALDTYSKNKANIINEGISAEEVDVIPDEEYNDFIDNGNVTEDRLNSIAEKVKDSQPLNDRENAIFTAKTAKINEILKKAKTTTQPKPVPPPPTPKSLLEIYKERINMLLNKDYYNLGENYDGVANKKPTQAEIDEFRTIKKGTKRYNELRQKLSDWKLLDSIVDEDYNSIAELIDLIDQLETKVEQEDTKTDVTESEAFTELREDEGTEGATFRPDLAVNQIAPATIKKRNDKKTYEITHILPSYVVGRLGGVFTVKRKTKELKNPDLDNLQPNDVVYVDNISFTYLAGGRLEFKQTDFETRQDLLNLYIRATNTVKWSFIDLYSEVGEVLPAIKTPSQFSEPNLKPEKIYDLRQGDRLTLHINSVGSWNSTTGDNEQQLKITMQNSNGDEVSIMKGDRVAENEAVVEGFLNIRKEAYKRWTDAGKPDKLDLEISVEVDGIFLGSPQLVIVDGVLQDIELSQKAIKEVVLAKGYILDGEVFIDREIKDIDRTYVAKISKNNAGMKQPLIIIKRGNTNIAFPISLIKKSQPVDFDGIYNSLKTPQEKIIAINDAIIKNNIETPKLGYADINNEEKIDATRTAFENKKATVTAEELASKEYKKESLNRDAVIKIDLDDLDQVFNAPKVRIKLDNTVVYKTDSKVLNNSLLELKSEASELFDEIYEKVNTDEGVQAIQNGDSNTFIRFIIDGSVGFNPKQITTRQVGINTNSANYKAQVFLLLREAYESLSVKETGLNTVGKTLVTKDIIKSVEKIMKRSDFILSQIAISDAQLKSGKNNTKC